MTPSTLNQYNWSGGYTEGSIKIPATFDLKLLTQGVIDSLAYILLP